MCQIQAAGFEVTHKTAMIGLGKLEMTIGATRASFPTSAAASIILTQRRIQNSTASKDLYLLGNDQQA